jgi:hypothetical protein
MLKAKYYRILRLYCQGFVGNALPFWKGKGVTHPTKVDEMTFFRPEKRESAGSLPS